MEGWKRRFDDPIVLPKGKPLLTLKDAAAYIMALPKKEADTAQWQAAIESLMLVAELGGPTMFARIGVMRALRRNGPKAASAPGQKRVKAYRIVR